MEYPTNQEQRNYAFDKEKLSVQRYEEQKKLCLTDIMMMRFRAEFKKQKISWSDEKFARSLGGDFFIENYHLMGQKQRKGFKGRTYQQGIYKSRNLLKEWLHGESLVYLTNDQLLTLERALGFQPEDYFIRRDHYGFIDQDKDQDKKHQYDIVSHCRPGGSVNSFLVTLGYMDENLNPTGKWHTSPRVELQRKLKLENERKVQKALKQERERVAKESKDNKGDRLKSLKNFFNFSRWEGKTAK